MGVTENGDDGFSFKCFSADFRVPLLQMIAVSVCHKDPAGFQFDHPLIGGVSKEIIISRNIVEWNVGELLVNDLTPFEITCVQKNVAVLFRRQNPEKNIVLRMGVSKDQNFHFFSQ